MSKFLEQIADYYTSGPMAPMLADITFILPNKRASYFLKRYIQQRVRSKFTLMPRFSNFGRLAANTVRMSEPSHFDLLFRLYDVYKEAFGDKAKDFDSFIFWGDMILSDFDQIDLALADPVKLYSNLEMLHDIAADYLSPEQKDIIRRIWGETNYTADHVERFWLHATHEGKETGLSEKFVSLWKLLGPMYTRFRNSLVAEGLATAGMQMGMALDTFKDMPHDQIRRRRYAFVGLSELSNAEIAIMERLQRAGAADFFWDLESPVFNSAGPGLSSANQAFRIISSLRKNFPMPSTFSLEKVGEMPDIEIVGVPSSVAQAKMAGEFIHRLNDSGALDGDKAIETAIVVPDPAQLAPLMLALPDGLSGINVTMGLPYSATTFATLFSSIISMQQRSREHRGRPTFFFQDVLEVLVHPHLQLIDPGHINSVRQAIFDQKMFNIDAAQLTAEFPSLAFIFKAVPKSSNLDDTYNYIIGLLRGIRDALARYFPAHVLKASFELEILDYFEKEVEQLHRLIAAHGIKMAESTFMMLFERILKSKTINVVGAPLHGLQVMGVLETRALDFDNIVILAMNERSFPKRDYIKTMIPNNLRRGYGLAPIERSESFYAYHFFRAIARAKKVKLLYDSRPPASGTGEMSRYLAQLLYLYGGGKVKNNVVELKGVAPKARDITVEKTPEVMAMLEKYKKEDGPKISASALKQYIKCPLAFYLQYVNGLRDDNEPEESLTAAELGDLFHKSAKRLFDLHKGSPLTAADLEAMANGEELEKILTQETASLYGLNGSDANEDDLNVEGRLARSQTLVQLRAMLLAEAATYCAAGQSFTYVEGERDVNGQWEVTPGLKVNFRMQIDRIDRIDRIDGSTLRFIDYKTGTDDSKVGDSIESLFSNDHRKHAVFQLLTYAEAYHDMVDPGVSISPALHIAKDILKEGVIKKITYRRQSMPDYPGLSPVFRPMLNDLFQKIFDDCTPFSQADDPEVCRYCSLINMCGRNLPPQKNFNR